MGGSQGSPRRQASEGQKNKCFTFRLTEVAKNLDGRPHESDAAPLPCMKRPLRTAVKNKIEEKRSFVGLLGGRQRQRRNEVGSWPLQTRFGEDTRNTAKDDHKGNPICSDLLRSWRRTWMGDHKSWTRHPSRERQEESQAIVESTMY